MIDSALDIEQTQLEPITDFEQMCIEDKAVRAALKEVKQLIADKIRTIDEYLQAFEATPT
jgi:hypothetical protein